MKKEVLKYYSLKKILAKKADYNLIFGERSNGKTYAALEYALRKYVTTGEQSAYIRRWRTDIVGKRGESLFQGHVNNGLIGQLTGDTYNDVMYLGGMWYLCKYDPDKKKRIPDPTPFCYAFSLSEVEHDKSTSYPNVTTIIFDEFLTRKFYLVDEFVIFMNVLSTIIRSRDNVKVFMLGNSVDKYCPYFSEMGLTNVLQMSQGTIDIYQFGENGAKVAVEYTNPTSTEKPSNKYFCFDNEHLQMITGGKWELAIYPHLPVKYKPKDVVFRYYILYKDNILDCEVICTESDNFTYIHKKTTPIRDTKNSLIYSLESNGKPNYKRRLLSTASKIEKRVAMYYASDKVFYQSNDVGEIVRNYIQASMKTNLNQY